LLIAAVVPHVMGQIVIRVLRQGDRSDDPGLRKSGLGIFLGLSVTTFIGAWVASRLYDRKTRQLDGPAANELTLPT
jgi:hypothetical protein